MAITKESWENCFATVVMPDAADIVDIPVTEPRPIAQEDFRGWLDADSGGFDGPGHWVRLGQR